MKMVMTRDEFNELKTKHDIFGIPLIGFIFNFNKGYVYNMSCLRKTFYGCKWVGKNSIPIEIEEG